MRSNNTADILIRFHGAIGNELCHQIYAAIDTPMDAVRLLEANLPGSVEKWFQTGLFFVSVNGNPVYKKSDINRKLSSQDVVDFVPIVAGALSPLSIGLIVIGVLLIAAAFLLRPSLNTGDFDKDARRFQSAANVNKEGAMVPIVYGRFRVGSVRASSSRVATQSVSSLERASILARQGDSFASKLLAKKELESGDLTEEEAIRSRVTEGVKGVDGVIRGGDIDTRVIDIISDGFCGGPVDGAKSILFNGTRFQNDDDTFNFPAVSPGWTLGTDPLLAEDAIPFLDDTATPIQISQDLTTNRTVKTLSAGLDAFRVVFSVSSFFKQKKNKVRSARAQLIVEISPTGLGQWQEVGRPLIIGEHLSEQFFQVGYPLERDTRYDVAIRRVSGEITNEKGSDKVSIDGIQEVRYSKVRFDGTSVLFTQYTNESFDGSNPDIEVIWSGRIIRVPSNYDVVTREYSGVWDGTWKTPEKSIQISLRPSDNPAFICRDILTNRKYGLGNKLQGKFDDYALFSIGKKCDELVSDGKGGLEPRYTFNGVIKERELAFQVLSDISATFHGRPFWSGNSVGFSTEEDNKTTRFIANDSNVVGGFFNYGSTDIEAEPNSISVTYSDKDDNYSETQATYRNHASVRKNGLIESQIDGIKSGITTQGQALRLARYVSFSSGQSVEFTGPEYFSGAQPGDVIEIFDSNWIGRRTGGRISSYDMLSKTVTLDSPVDALTGDIVLLNLPTGQVEELQVAAPSNSNVVTLSSNPSLTPQPESVFGIHSPADGPRNKFVIQARSDQGDGTFAISAITYDEDKLFKIEQGVKAETIENPPTQDIRFVSPPTQLQVSSSATPEPQGVRYRIKISWQAPVIEGGVIGYDVDYEIDGGQRTTLARGVRSTFASLDNAEEGTYVFFVRARSLNAVSSFEQKLFELEDLPPSSVERVTGLELFNSANNTEFSNRDAKFVWRYSSSLQENEFGEERHGASSDFEDNIFKEFVVKITDDQGNELRTEEGIKTNEYTYTLEKNIEDGGPYRSIGVQVFYRDRYNNLSRPDTIFVSNPPPAPPSGISVSGGIGQFLISYTVPQSLLDFAGVIVYAGDVSGFVADEAAIVADTNASVISIESPPDTQKYFRIAAYDTFGKEGLVLSSEFTATTQPTVLVDTQFSFSGIDFQANSPLANDLLWTSGNVVVRKDDQQQTYAIAAGSVNWVGPSTLFVYYIEGEGQLRTSSDATDAYGVNRRVVAHYNGGSKLATQDGGGVIIDGDRISAGTIGSASLVTGQAVITGSAQIANGIIGSLQIANTIQSTSWGEVSKNGWIIDKNGNIRGKSITIYGNSGQVLFSSGGASLNAITDAGAFAGLDQINTGNISTYIGSAAISDAYISNLNASKINAGQINTDRITFDNITLANEGGNLVIKDNGVTTGKIQDGAVTQLNTAVAGTTEVYTSAQTIQKGSVSVSGFNPATHRVLTLVNLFNVSIDGGVVSISVRITNGTETINVGFNAQDELSTGDPRFFSMAGQAVFSTNPSTFDVEIDIQFLSPGAIVTIGPVGVTAFLRKR